MLHITKKEHFKLKEGEITMLLKIKGHEIKVMPVKNSFNRRAVQYKNKIIEILRKIGVPEDDIEVHFEPMAIKKLPASVSWFVDNQYLYYSYSQSNKYVDNLHIVFKVIECEVKKLIETEDLNEFIKAFTEDQDITKQREEARITLGVPPDCIDVALIDKQYKLLAKKLHPDMPTGDLEEFKKINKAHKILKRELL